jgi:hypothetical protein
VSQDRIPAQFADERLRAAYIRALAAICAHEPPARVARQLIGDGVSAPDATTILRAIHARLVAERRLAQRAQKARPRRIQRLHPALGLSLVLVAYGVGLGLGWRTAGYDSTSLQPFAVRAVTPVAATIQPVPNAIAIARLNVRSGPEPHAPVVFELHANQPLIVIEQAKTAGQIKVRLPDAREGWIRSDPNLVQIYTSIDHLPDASMPR